MELVPTGKVNAWLYGHRDTRFKGASASVAVPSGWTPAFKAEGERGNGYLAGLYVGPAEVLSSSFDGLARPIQTRARAGANDVVTQTMYNRAGKSEKLLGPVYQPPSYTYSGLTDAAAGSRITTTTYDDDPLLRVSRVIPPGHTAATAVDTRYGYWGAESGHGRSYMTVDDEKGINTATVYDAYGRMIHLGRMRFSQALCYTGRSQTRPVPIHRGLLQHPEKTRFLGYLSPLNFERSFKKSA